MDIHRIGGCKLDISRSEWGPVVRSSGNGNANSGHLKGEYPLSTLAAISSLATTILRGIRLANWLSVSQR